MHSADRAIDAPALRPHRVRAVGGWTAGVLFALMLAGCGTSPTRPAQQASVMDDVDWYGANDQSDPIAALLRSKGAQPTARKPGAAQEDAAQTPTGLVSTAMTLLGIRYRYGGNNPDEGFDCSGLVTYAFQQSLGMKLPRNAAEMARLGNQIDRTDLKAGDLVFFNTLGRRYSHVGIYVGDNSFVHSPSSGGVVRVENMDMRYWKKRYNGARRLEPGLLASR
ncbi:Cell wall-associated hydrolases (invasion-associated proteins) [plant metagenome]|uniref:Cell wall-associated hydrolases (Invasion-associated proteins) n=1 Tax=plant metagenome TaxID=1297885 RepID=A0A484STI8_9ZZZZ